MFTYVHSLLYILLLSGLHGAAESVPKLPVNPRQTSVEDNAVDQLGWTPKPTPGPQLDLLKRQAALPPTSLCGYFDGDPDQPLGCNGVNGQYCAFNSDLFAVGCCATYFSSAGQYPLTGCLYYTACYDFTDVPLAPATDIDNNLVAKCASVDPYCVFLTYPEVGYGQYDCQTSPGSYVILVSSTVASISTSSAPVSTPSEQMSAAGQASSSTPLSQSVPAATIPSTHAAPIPFSLTQKMGHGSQPTRMVQSSQTGAAAGQQSARFCVVSLIVALAADLIGFVENF